jgi:hypothetical protein
MVLDRERLEDILNGKVDALGVRWELGWGNVKAVKVPRELSCTVNEQVPDIP